MWANRNILDFLKGISQFCNLIATICFLDHYVDYLMFLLLEAIQVVELENLNSWA